MKLLELRYALRYATLLCPLFMVVSTSSPAFADVLFTADTTGCGPISGTSTGSVQTSPFSLLNGVAGISLSGNCAVFVPAFSSGSGFELSAVMSGGSGGASTFLSDSMPIAWSFMPNSDVFAEIDWTVWVTINGLEQDFGGTAFPGDFVTGSGAVNIPQGGTLDNWRAGIGFSQPESFDSDTNLSLDIPGSSLDINPSSVPEPDSALLVLGAFIILAVRHLTRFRAG